MKRRTFAEYEKHSFNMIFIFVVYTFYNLFFELEYLIAIYNYERFLREKLIYEKFMDILLIFMIVCIKKKDDAISGISKLDYIIKVSCT